MLALRGWGVFPEVGTQLRHVAPASFDGQCLDGHFLYGHSCWCGVTIDDRDPRIVIHEDRPRIDSAKLN